jgi:hypothetical protein
MQKFTDCSRYGGGYCREWVDHDRHCSIGLATSSIFEIAVGKGFVIVAGCHSSALSISAKAAVMPALRSTNMGTGLPVAIVETTISMTTSLALDPGYKLLRTAGRV